MTPYWQHQHGMTPDEKKAFVERVKDENVAFLGNLRKITDSADNRMLTRVARDRISGTDNDDADDLSLEKP